MKKTSNVIISILLVISLATLVVSYFAGLPDFMGILFNSDILFLPTLFSDLMLKGGHLSDWYFSQAFFFCPDYLFFFLAYLLGPTVSIQIPIFTAIQALSTFFALYLLFYSMKEARAFFLAGTASIMLFWLALNSGEPFKLLIASVFHYGVFLISIVFVALWMNVEKKKKPFNSISFWLLSILAFLSTLSDALFVTQTVIPFVITVIIISVVEKTLTIKKVISVLIPTLFSILGIISYDYLVVNNILTSIVGLTPFKNALINLVSFKMILSKFESIFMLFYSVIIKTPIYGFIFFIYGGFALFSVIQLFNAKKSFQFSVPRHLVWLGLFSLISLLVSSSALLLTNIPPVRYLIPSFEWPIIFVLLVLFHNANTSRFVLYATITSLVITTSLIFSTYKLIKVNGLNADYYPDEIACIDQALNQLNVSNGIAEYWDAKRTKMLSRLDLNIAQYDVNLHKYQWITSRRYFKENYDFALQSENTSPHAKLPLDIIYRINGPPKQVIHCGNKTLHIYEKGNYRPKGFSKVGPFV